MYGIVRFASRGKGLTVSSGTMPSARVRQLEKVSYRSERNPTDSAKRRDKQEEWNSAQQRRASVVDCNQERKTETESIERACRQPLSLRTPSANGESDQSPRNQAVDAEREIVMPADSYDRAQNSRGENLVHRARLRTDAGGGRNACRSRAPRAALSSCRIPDAPATRAGPIEQRAPQAGPRVQRHRAPIRGQ